MDNTDTSDTSGDNDSKLVDVKPVYTVLSLAFYSSLTGMTISHPGNTMRDYQLLNTNTILDKAMVVLEKYMTEHEANKINQQSAEDIQEWKDHIESIL